MATVITLTANNSFNILLDSSEFSNEDYSNHVIPRSELRISQKAGANGNIDLYWNGDSTFEVELNVHASHTVTVAGSDASDNDDLRAKLLNLM